MNELLFDNPFLRRESRRFFRLRLAAGAYWVLACLGCMALVLVGAALLQGRINDAQWLQFSMSRFRLLGMMVFFHVVLVVIAAGYGGYRILLAEHFSSTLDGVLLAPLSAGKWLQLRIVFPLVFTTLAWLCGAPFYLLIVLLQFESTHNLLPALLTPLLAGFGVLVMLLCITPDYVEQAKRWNSQDASRARPWSGQERAWLLLLLAYWLPLGLLSGLGPWGRTRPFYSFEILDVWLWLPVMALAVLASAVTALAAIRAEVWDGVARTARLVALIFLFYSGLGLVWQYLSEWAQWALPFGFPALIITVRRLARTPSEDPLAAGEMRWAARFALRFPRACGGSGQRLGFAKLGTGHSPAA